MTMSFKCPQCGSTQIQSKYVLSPKQESDKNTAVMTLMGASLGSIIPVLGTVLGAGAGWLTGEVVRIFGSGFYLINRCEKCHYTWHHNLSHLDNKGENENLTTNKDFDLTVKATRSKT